MKNHKKAFTLTELLVVVIVLGVLAGVCAPKFMRVLETRKTTEAEELLGAVRTEQEQRCVLGKSYLTAPDKVEALASAGHSKNYTYSLQSTGASASSDKGYTLKMLSYKEGSLCCEGEYCDKLNKSYPKCSDTPVSDECAGEVRTEPTPGTDPEDPCVSNPNSCACGTYASANQCECAGECTACERNPNSCACETYAAEHAEECNPESCTNKPDQEKCCDPVTQKWDDGMCVDADPCDDPAYKRTHGCECYQDAANCCTWDEYDGNMEYDPASGKCMCPAGAVWENNYCGCDPGEENASAYCCGELVGGSWKDGKCSYCKSGNDSASCCKEFGGTWTGSSCTRTCTGYGDYKQTALYSSDGGNSFRSGMWSIGTNMGCGITSSLWSSALSKAGGRECGEYDEEIDVFPTDFNDPQDLMGLSCAEEADIYAGQESFSCAFRSTYQPTRTPSGGSAYGYPEDCIVGYITCTGTKKTWTCNIDQRCDDTVGNCY